MSAYGTLASKTADIPPLPSIQWRTLTTHHINLARAWALPGLLEYLHPTFAQEVEDGRTYPQEGAVDQDAFEKYFFAADVILGIVGSGNEIQEGEEVGSLEESRQGRSWEECVGGFYYIKPNYPGRSSHICNAGFVVPPRQRGGGHGKSLARSFLYYAPKLGYRASVFNLVFVNNTASIKLWDRLGFKRAGCIPQAGRLKTKDGDEEYVDAWVYYKSFVEDEAMVEKTISENM